MDTKTLGQLFIVLGIMFGMVLFVGNGQSTAAHAPAARTATATPALESVSSATATADAQPEYFSASGEGQFMANGQLVGGR